MDGIVHLRAKWTLFVLFVCLVFFVPLEDCSLIWRRQHRWWKAANFDLCSVLMAIEQFGFFNLPHLLWHGASVYNSHLRGPLTLTLVAVTYLPVFATKFCRSWDSNTQPFSCEVNALAHCATAVVAEWITPPVFEKVISRTLYIFKTVVRVSGFKKSPS